MLQTSDIHECVIWSEMSEMKEKQEKKHVRNVGRKAAGRRSARSPPRQSNMSGAGNIDQIIKTNT